MKKVLSLALVIVMVFALCIPAVAASVNSPSADTKNTVTVIGGNSTPVEKTNQVVLNGEETITLTPLAGKQFNSWKFYKQGTDANGAKIAVAAVEGTDYVVVSNDTTTNVMVIRPLTDVIATGNYANETTDPSIALASETSPKTGDSALVLAIFAVVALAGVAFASKKVLA